MKCSTVRSPNLQRYLCFLLVLAQHQVFAFTEIHVLASVSFTSTRATSTTRLFETNDNDNKNKKNSNSSFISKGVPSYSDNWLFACHNQAQQEYQLLTNSLQTWNAQQQREQENIREWQDSFQRNGLADFTPPMSFGLNCLMVGDGNEGAEVDSTTAWETKLPWEDEAEADITSLRASVVVQVPDEIEEAQEEEASMKSGGTITNSNTIQIQTELVPSQKKEASAASAATGLRVISKQAAVYDCIVDQGLLGSVMKLAKNNNGNDNTDDDPYCCSASIVQDVLNEAALSLREHGIYVVTTTGQTLTSNTKQMLETIGKEAGLEWQFELDGISDEHQQVSVARRFNTGAMPAMGKLTSFFKRKVKGLT